MAAEGTAAQAQVEVAVMGSALGAHPGAEIVGLVREAGESARHLLDQVVVVPRLLPCGECELCRRGRLANCSALFRRPTRPQTVEVLPARFLLPLPGPASTEDAFRRAVLSDALLAPYAGLARAGVGPGTLVVVLGGGSRGALSVVAAKMVGAQVAVLCTSGDERSRLCAPPYDALTALDPSILDAEAVLSALRRLCLEVGLPPHGLCLLETSGSDAGRARALSLLEAGGTAVLLDRAQPLDAPAAGPPPGLAAAVSAGPELGGVALLERITAQGCTVLGAGPPHPDLLPELCALVERAGLPLATLTRIVKPADIDAVMTARRRSAEPDALLLPIVRFDDAASSLGRN